ncbi:hypothetical protein [Ramlibacter tataouinensis]|uniref:hypothetical protein n=1 Tax=Ramlibacter tataouinensis TaxID=94132 RepID=UPI0002F6BCCC|nr:hypothetical protein [Ramlibacter tataouinensis]
MALESKSPTRFADAPRDKPQVDRVEHANLERPGAQFHPRARAGWERHGQQRRGWRMH